MLHGLLVDHLHAPHHALVGLAGRQRQHVGEGDAEKNMRSRPRSWRSQWSRLLAPLGRPHTHSSARRGAERCAAPRRTTAAPPSRRAGRRAPSSRSAGAAAARARAASRQRLQPGLDGVAAALRHARALALRPRRPARRSDDMRGPGARAGRRAALPLGAAAPRARQPAGGAAAALRGGGTPRPVHRRPLAGSLLSRALGANPRRARSRSW